MIRNHQSLKSSFADQLYAQWQREDRSVPCWVPSLVSQLQIDGGNFRLRGLARRLEALSLPCDPLRGELAPPIELAVVVAPKDFATAAHAIDGALLHSRNPIVTIRMITPAHSLSQAKRQFKHRFGIGVDVLADEECLSEASRKLLRSRFEARYGWVLQQFLCVWAVINGSHSATLIIDADTVLTRDRTFFGNARQILPVSIEYHEPYFRLVRRLGIWQSVSRHSHVVHHMLQQAAVWKMILSKVSDGSLEDLVKSVVSLAERDQGSALSVDYELYAQGLLHVSPSLAIETKWSNLSLRMSGITQFDDWLTHSKLPQKYFSVSCHSHGLNL